MRHITFLTLFVLVFAVSLSIISSNPNYAVAGELLDGKSFQVKITEYGKGGQPTDDVLIFKDGTFFSTNCEQYGFGTAMYESVSKSGAILFEATSTSKTEGKNEWEGKVQGDSITGNFMWSKPGQEPIFYTYAGSLKK